MASEFSLGKDEFNNAESLRILFIIAITAFFVWQFINNPAERFRATAYGLLSLLALSALVFDRLDKKEYIDTVLEDTEQQPSIISSLTRNFGTYTVIAVVSLFLIAFVFWQVQFGTKVTIVGAPTFQTIPQDILANPYYNAFMSGIVGFIENAFFFSFIFATIYGFFGRALNGVPFVAFVPSSLISSGIFTIFHFAVYGFNAVPQMQAVFLFGMINCFIIYLFRSLVPSDAYHFGNNFFITLAQHVRF